MIGCIAFSKLINFAVTKKSIRFPTFLTFRHFFLPVLFFGDDIRVVRKLEHKRTVTSISLAEERQILKEINVVKKTKMKVEEFIKAENEVQSMKVRTILCSVSLSGVFWLLNF